MKMPLLFALLAFCAAFCRPIYATSNYTYKKGEYVTIKNGVSPDRKYSLATHGDGEEGYKNFHVYLMREPGHKKIGPLTEIEEDILDTAATAYQAVWSPDSRHVAVLYRADRNELTMNLYRFERGRAFPIPASTYDLIRAASKQVGASNAQFFDGSNRQNSFYEIRWLSSTRFSLEEEGLFYTNTPKPARAMKQYGEAQEDTKNTPKQYGNAVSVAAVCEILKHGDVVRIVSLKPGPFTISHPK